ncbi:MAG TPA: hypothetical protein VMG37_00910 [Solirubrobacteraceae bacterium]|nr:hypothetical protein [Solirubrobacteraceae bacterium]
MGYLTQFGIELDIDATPIAGYIADAGGRRPFHGWLELCSAIEEQRAAVPRTAGPSERSTAPWLARRTLPRWILLGAWACAGWCAVAFLALAITRHTRGVA